MEKINTQKQFFTVSAILGLIVIEKNGKGKPHETGNHGYHPSGWRTDPGSFLYSQREIKHSQDPSG
jgi:hypothetical protein